MAINIKPSQGGVRTTHPDYNAMQSKWSKARDTICGEDAIKQAGEIYLPKLTDQQTVDYIAYKQRGSFYNATARTVQGLLGMVFRKPPVVTLPAGLSSGDAPIIDDIDMCGCPLDMFASEIVEEALSVGRIGILVDHTTKPEQLPGPLTVAIAQQLNLRPFLKIYTAENVINWKFARVGNTTQLVMVVLHECIQVPTIDQRTQQPSEFATENKDQWRVLDILNTIYRVRVFDLDDQGNDRLISEEIPELNGNPLNFIPFIMISDCGESFEAEDPPLLDLININLSHWRTSCDYEHGAHFTALPTLFLAGYAPTVPENGEPVAKLYLGSQSIITSTDASAKANFIEFTGQGLGALEKSMDRKEQQMAILGARMLATEGRQQQTATTTAIHRTGENSVLAQIAISISLGLTKVLTWLSNWAGFTGEVDYQLNRDFLPVPIDGPALTAVIQAYQQGALNKEELFDWFQRGDIIEADVKFEDHLKGEFNPRPDPNSLPTGGNLQPGQKPDNGNVQRNPAQA